MISVATNTPALRATRILEQNLAGVATVSAANDGLDRPGVQFNRQGQPGGLLEHAEESEGPFNPLTLEVSTKGAPGSLLDVLA